MGGNDEMENPEANKLPLMNKVGKFVFYIFYICTHFFCCNTHSRPRDVSWEIMAKFTCYFLLAFMRDEWFASNKPCSVVSSLETVNAVVLSCRLAYHELVVHGDVASGYARYLNNDRLL